MQTTFFKSEFDQFLSRYYFSEFKKIYYDFDWSYENRRWIRKNIEINEFCYLIYLTDKYCLKIYSSIERGDKKSRGYGLDAIRIVPIRREDLKPIRIKFKRVNRGFNWKNNFRLRISEILENLGNDMRCPRCEAKLVMRKNIKRRVNFLGCSRFPDCNGNRNIEVKC
jgi:ssDNA-binding Zn-finger/Zn-ribbon topoisomerase 1